MEQSIKHLAIIMDGNQRWSKKNNLRDIDGYNAGLNKLSEILKYCLSKKIQNLSVYALSSENLKRNNIGTIYNLIKKNYIKFLDKIRSEKKIRVNIIGNKKNLPNELLKIFDYLQNDTKKNFEINLNIIFNYGVNEELKHIIKNMIDEEKEINDANIQSFKYMKNFPDPDLLIRTGGYKRLSNFLLLNIAYTELFFTETFWPDFEITELRSILKTFLQIKRNYGL